MTILVASLMLGFTTLSEAEYTVSGVMQ